MTPPLLNVRRLLAYAALGLLLVLTQQHATRHWLSHAIEAAQGKADGTPAKSHCDECDALASLDAGMSGPAHALVAPSSAPSTAPTHPQPAPPLPARVAAYRSRAPPLFG